MVNPLHSSMVNLFRLSIFNAVSAKFFDKDSAYFPFAKAFHSTNDSGGRVKVNGQSAALIHSQFFRFNDQSAVCTNLYGITMTINQKANRITLNRKFHSFGGVAKIMK